ncbi:MAG: hypothetical protein AB1499_07040 [Nitrospirota bacterium]
MGLALRVVLIGLLIVTIGCASAPRQTVELTEIVDSQIAEMQVSHEKFVHLYYDKMRSDVEIFMEERWIPQFLANVVEGTGPSSKQFREDLDVAYKLASRDWAKEVKISGITDEDVKKAVNEAIEKLASSEKAKLGMVLLDFSQAAQRQINKQRKSLIDPLNEQEAYVLDQLRESYADLQRSTMAIKGYLSSVVNLVEQRDEVLQKVGALETQKKIIDTAVKLSDDAAVALKSAEKTDVGISQFLEKIEKAKEEFAKITNKGGDK